MKLVDCLTDVEQHGPGFTVELLKYDGHERTVYEFRHHEGLRLDDTDADIHWYPGSHFHEGEKAGEIELHYAPDQQEVDPRHHTILIRYHEARK